MDLDQKIKVAAGVNNPNTNYILELLDELYQLPMDPRILKEKMAIVETIKVMRGYVGPVSHVPGISPYQGEELNARVILILIDLTKYYNFSVALSKNFIFYLFYRFLENGCTNAK